MLLRALCGLINLDSGTIKIDNKVLHEDMDFPESIGILIESSNLLNDMNAFDNLYTLSRIKKIVSKEDISDKIISMKSGKIYED